MQQLLTFGSPSVDATRSVPLVASTMLKKWPVGATRATMDLSATLILAFLRKGSSRGGYVMVDDAVMALEVPSVAHVHYVGCGDALAVSDTAAGARINEKMYDIAPPSDRCRALIPAPSSVRDRLNQAVIVT